MATNDVQRNTNRLARETSPYLLQHAHNPVDWYPWGDEAFTRAQAEDKPVFLSIGYSSCHWCHVMERESFEDERVARYLNEHFVSVKVDREERPDVDRFYMDACMALTGRGGWPLSCFLTPDRRPFYAGTYFPKEDRYGMPGLMSILTGIFGLWRKDRQSLLNVSEKMIRHIGEKTQATAQDAAGAPQAAYRQLAASFDGQYGGFGHAPKFPAAHNLLFLLRYGILHGDKEEAFAMVDKTLRCMKQGGIFDHIGGGFCRYSTDERWLVPHFEKMMYDNAMLAVACCEAGAAVDPAHFKTARRVLGYCLREMADGAGSFYTAQDADSEGVEGKYYVFAPEEAETVLGAQEGKRFCELFDITQNGNFEGGSIPNHIGRTLSEEEEAFADACANKLYAYRARRVPPFKDDKILTSVNGLMIVALATAGRLLREDKYTQAAERCATFILGNLVAGGRLRASYRDGVAAHPATLEDYAYLAWGFFELYQTSLRPRWLRQACGLIDRVFALFDDQGGAFYQSGSDINDLPVRTKNLQDGELPSGNAVLAGALLRISTITGNGAYEKKAAEILETASGECNRYPAGYTTLLMAQMLRRDGIKRCAVVNGQGAEALIEAAQTYQPFALAAACGPGYEEMAALAPELAAFKAADGEATVFLCDRHGCRPPVRDAGEVRRFLRY